MVFDKRTVATDDSAVVRLLEAQADAVPQILWTSDTNGDILSANRRFREYTGLTLVALQSSEVLTTIHPDDIAAYLPVREWAIATGTDWEYAFRIRRHDGAFRWHLGRCVPNRNEHGSITHWFGSATDIHNLKSGGDAMRQNRERLDLALATSGIGTAVYDLVKQTVRADPRTFAIFDLPPADETPFSLWTDCVHPGDRARTQAALEQLLAAPENTYNEQYRVRRGDGWRIVAARAVVSQRDADGEPVEIVAVAQDITEREQERDAATDALRREAAILDGMSDGYVLLDRDYRIVRTNAAAERLNRKPASAFVGKLHWEAWPPSVGSPIEEHLRRVMETHTEAHFEHHYRDSGVYDYWLKVDMYPVPDGGVAIFYADITDRKRTEEALRDSEARLLLAVQTAQMGFSEFDIATNTARLSPILCQIVGLASGTQTLSPDRWFTQVVDEDVAPLRAAWLSLLSGESDSIRIHYRMHRFDTGAVVWILSRASLVRGENGAPQRILGVVFDETGERETQEALRQNTQTLRSLSEQRELAFRAARIGIWDWDVAGDQGYWSPEQRRLFGLPEDLGGDYDRFLEFLHPGDREQVSAYMQSVVNNPSILEYADEFRIVRADGETRWLYGRGRIYRDPDTGTATHVTGVNVDVTERKTAELALSNALQQVASHMENSPLAVIEWDTDWRIVQWSRGAEALYGYTAAEMIGKTGTEWNHLHPDDVPAVVAMYPDLGTQKRSATRVRNFTRTGEIVHCEWYNTAITDERGNFVSVLSQILNVSERVHAAVALAESHKKQTRIAQTLQQSLLQTPPEDAFPGVELGMLYEAAWDEAQVGGDFHDAFAVHGDSVCFVVGDVTGKGLKAALFTAEVKFVLRAYMQQTRDVTETLVLVNRYLCDRRDERNALHSTFIAVSVLLMNTATGRVECALGGMEPPLVYRCDTGTVEEMSAQGLVLGADNDAQYEPVTIDLHPGDILVSATDGFTEARDSKRRFWELTGLAECVRESLTGEPDIRPDALAKVCLQQAKEWSNGRLADDACLLVARYMGTARG